MSAGCGDWLIFIPARVLTRAGGLFEGHGVGEEQVGLAGGHQGCGELQAGNQVPGFISKLVVGVSPRQAAGVDNVHVP